MTSLCTTPTTATIHVQAVRLQSSGVRIVRAVPTTLHITTSTARKTGHVFTVTASSRPR